MCVECELFNYKYYTEIAKVKVAKRNYNISQAQINNVEVPSSYGQLQETSTNT